MAKKQVRVYTAVFGEKHIDWWKRGCLKSLSWHDNAEALDGATWTFLTKKEDQPTIEAAVRSSGINIKDIEYFLIDSEIPGNHPMMGSLLLRGWLEEMSRAITFNTQILLAPPDTVFGESTVKHLREIGEQKDSVVFMVHPRVTTDILPHIDKCTTIFNKELVSLAWENLHKTWVDAEVGLEKSNSYIGGVSWRYLNENLYSVTHRLPTPYLINPTPEDIVYFRGQLHFGVIDHFWPHECLIEFERQRLVGSSDAGFCVEITPANENIPPVEHVRKDEPDLFHRNLTHNKQNRMTSVIFRGEQ